MLGKPMTALQLDALVAGFLRSGRQKTGSARIVTRPRQRPPNALSDCGEALRGVIAFARTDLSLRGTSATLIPCLVLSWRCAVSASFAGHPASCLTKATCYRYEISGKVPRFGGIALIRATLFRAFVLSAALAGALTPVAVPWRRRQSVAGKGNEGAFARTALAAPPKEDAEDIRRSFCAFSRKKRNSKSGSRTPPAISRFSRPIRSVAGRAILGRKCMRATVRLLRVSIRLRPS